ncbi:MAG: preprotein translocase subunit YajC [Bacteroidales bacterium]|nr:preprotein translocase subunit YajC [Bacteroidales bacterium]
MNILTFTLLQAAGGAAQPQGGGWTMWVMLILIFVVMYFFMIRPQRKQQKEAEQFRNSLQAGDKVVTIGGIFGTIREVNDNTVLLTVDNGVTIRVAKSAVQKDFTAQQ